MTRMLLLLNGAFLVLILYAFSTSWSATGVVSLLVFATSFGLLTLPESRTGNLVLLIGNGAFAALSGLLALVATIGGLFTYGPGAIASVILLVPAAVFAANAAHGRRLLAA